MDSTLWSEVESQGVFYTSRSADGFTTHSFFTISLSRNSHAEQQAARGPHVREHHAHAIVGRERIAMREAVVIACEERLGQRSLVAYFVPHRESPLTHSEFSARQDRRNKKRHFLAGLSSPDNTRRIFAECFEQNASD